jgi:D-amino peptidase
MKAKAIVICLVLTAAMTCGTNAGPKGQEEGLKVFISVDMEGVAGVVHWDEVEQGKTDYEMFRRLMTEEANAAIDGALQAGATEILVRDSHWSARNLLPDELREEATLLREWSGGPMGMMEGLDQTFDAAIFIGYHGRAGAILSPLGHTMSGRILSVHLNGKEMPEAGLNAAKAGTIGVPVVMVAGDASLCEEATALLGRVETAPVKEGIGIAAKSLHPTKARELIKKKVAAALKDLKSFKPYKLNPPYTMKITFNHQNHAHLAAQVPGAKQEGERVIVFSEPDLMEVMKRLWISLAVAKR